MKNQFTRARIAFIFLVLIGLAINSNGQCVAGSNQVTLNWEYLDYFPYNGNYTSSTGYLPSNNYSRTQRFAFGTQMMTIVHNFADANELGEDNLHTGETNSYGSGDDIHFIGNGTITITFDQEVRNLQFSIYDIDRSQVGTISARNAANVPQLVGISKAVPLSGTIGVLGGLSAIATATSATVSNSSSNNTVNISITGPVKTLTIQTSSTGSSSGGNDDGSFWISDITACSPGNFTNNYYNVAQPFTGQGSYILQSFDRSVYVLNPATGKTRLLFTDNTTPLGAITASNRCFINSMAYDPYNRILYYVYSLTSNAGVNGILRKYDMATGTISTVLSNISSTTYGTGVGIPYVSSASGFTNRGTGVESGAAAFYDGSLYLGIETSGKNSSGSPLGNTNREAVIWRIDFDATNTPYRAAQVFAMPVDNGSGTLMHDWSDFAITNGVLYDFDGAGVTTQTDVYHFNFLTGNAVNYHVPSGWTPGQPAVAWDNTIYQMYATTAAPAVSPYVARYNNDGTIGTQIPIFSTPMYTPAIPSLGDAAEGFRPDCDFGDAPASYDPVALSPAVHEYFNELSLGANWGAEWVKKTSTLADGDDEDGVPYTNPFNPGSSTYYNDVDVYNNTGANATLIGWLDFNGNGIFDAGEASAVKTISSSASMQTIHLNWTGISSTLPLGSFTFMRVRLAPASDGMSAANPTGFYEIGEVEDYRIYVGLYPLAVKLLSFDAQATPKGNAELHWTATEDADFAGYAVEKSIDGRQWQAIGYVAGNRSAIKQSYSYTDKQSLSAKTFYRLQLRNTQGAAEYSETRVLSPAGSIAKASISPNPASSQVTLEFTTARTAEQVSLRILNLSGHQVYSTKLTSTGGTQQLSISVANWSPGTYFLLLHSGEQLISQKLIVQ